MINQQKTERYKVIVIGAGQAGLSAGYFLSKHNIPFVILDASERVGDSWRNRWDSLHLFTPAKFDGLAGMPFPAPPNSFPSKDEMGDYLESYAKHFNLPVRSGTKADGLKRDGDLYTVTAGDKSYQAEHVVVAMSNFQNPKIPGFANQLNPDIVQLHSIDYKEPSQLQKGDVLVVGAANSGCEIALEAVKNNHRVWLSGREVGHIPFPIDSMIAKLIMIRLVIRVIFHRILTTGTPIGRKKRPEIISKGTPLIRIKPKDIIEAGIERIPKIADVKNGLPVTEDNQVLDVRNIVWSTGFYPSFSWIDVPVFKNGEPMQNRGVVDKEQGLYFVGLDFLFARSSAMIHGVKRDAEYVTDVIRRRVNGKD